MTWTAKEIYEGQIDDRTGGSAIDSITAMLNQNPDIKVIGFRIPKVGDKYFLKWGEPNTCWITYREPRLIINTYER